MPRARGQSPTSHHQGIPTNINRPISLIPAGDSTPIPVRGMPQTQQPSTLAAPPPTRSPRQCFSAVASDRRCRPPSHTWEILRGSFRSSSTYSHRLPIEAGLPTPSVPPLHYGRNRPLLQGHPAHHRPVRRGYRRTGFVPPIQGRCQTQNGHLAGCD